MSKDQDCCSKYVQCTEMSSGTEIDESIKIKILVQRANGISATVDWINEEPRSYKCFKYGNIIDNIFLLENSLSISHGDYLNIYINPKKLDRPINPRRTKFCLECDIWSRRTAWDYRDKTNTTDHFIASNGIDVTEFRNKKCSYPRLFDSYRDYRMFIEDTWKCERITITEKDVATFQNLDNKEIIKVWLGGAGKEKCSCGAIENNVITILCPEDKIMSFRSKRDFESYHYGEEIYDSHHFNVYLES